MSGWTCESCGNDTIVASGEASVSTTIHADEEATHWSPAPTGRFYLDELSIFCGGCGAKVEGELAEALRGMAFENLTSGVEWYEET